MVTSSGSMVEEDQMAGLPSRDAAKEFYMKYDVKERLGRGLSSVVHLCIDKMTGKEYAAKIMDISQDHVNADGMNIVEQIHEEIRLLKLVEGHKYIIRLEDVFESPAFLFLVFELCQNYDLFEYLSANVSLSEKRCRAIMKEVFEAVHHCHQRRVLHRDIKPENILLDKNYNIKLTDFGLAKEIKGDERLYECVGTPGYLAPEVLEAGMCERSECNGYSFEVDAWACGVVMFTLLVGTPPFWHHRQLQMIRLIMRGTYRMDSPAWSAITTETKDLIRKLLVVDPKKRLTIEEALNHEVFHAQRFTRVGGELVCVDDLCEDDNAGAGLDNVVNGQEAGVQMKDENKNLDQGDEKVPEIIVRESSEKETVTVRAMSSKKKLSKVPSSVKDVKFNARQTFKTAIVCVRFLVRLCHIKSTPELLSLQQTRVDPYHMRSYRKSIDKVAFSLYHHWIKKGQGQDRAAVFQHFPKREAIRLAGKKDSHLMTPR